VKEEAMVTEKSSPEKTDKDRQAADSGNGSREVEMKVKTGE
jgi:hypothetical protein